MDSAYNKQSGIAIVSVLVVIALVSVSIVSTWDRQHENYTSTKYQLDLQKNLSYLHSFELWAKTIILNDDETVDHLDEDWALAIPSIEIPDGQMSGQLSDLQARLNINNLVQFDDDFKRILGRRSGYQNCLNILNNNLNQVQISESVYSYIDQIGSKPIKDATELKKVNNFDFEKYQQIKPYVFAASSLTPVNINTASEEVLACLYSQEFEGIIDFIVNNRQGQPFLTIEDFWSFVDQQYPDVILDQVKTAFPKVLVGTSSQYFLLEAEIEINNKKLVAKTTFFREEKTVNIVNRSYQLIP